MRVCHVAYSHYPFDPRVRREVETLLASGYEVDVICLQSGEELREEVVRGARVHRLPLVAVRGGRLRYAYQYAVFFLLSLFRLLALHIRRGFSVIHVHSLPDFEVFVAVPEKLTGASVILDLHEAMPEIFASRFAMTLDDVRVRIAKVLEFLSCAFADSVFVVNESIRELLMARGAGASGLTVVMNSVDVEKIDSLEQEVGTVHASPRTAFRIVYVGGLNPERDLTSLVRASARIQQLHPHELLLYGYGEEGYKEMLREVARQEGHGESFYLGPAVQPEEAQSLIAQSGLGAVTYVDNHLTRLALPNKVFEYAAARKPLVIADLPALRRTFGDSALYYRPGDADDLARQITVVLENPHLARSLADRAYFVVRGLSWRQMAERMLRVYVTNNRGRVRLKTATPSVIEDEGID